MAVSGSQLTGNGAYMSGVGRQRSFSAKAALVVVAASIFSLSRPLARSLSKDLAHAMVDQTSRDTEN